MKLISDVCWFFEKSEDDDDDDEKENRGLCEMRGNMSNMAWFLW